MKCEHCGQHEDSISWKKIIENTLSTVFAVLIVSAGAIVWVEATSVDDKVDDATEVLVSQGEFMEKAIELLEGQLVLVQHTQSNFVVSVNQLIEEHKKLMNDQEKLSGHKIHKEKREWPNMLEQKSVPNDNYIQDNLPKMRYPASKR